MSQRSTERNKAFPQSVLFYKDPKELDAVRAQIDSKLNFDPVKYANPQREITRRLIETSGVATLMLAGQEQLEERVGDFLKGEIPVVFIAGHSGNGKSLLSTDLQRMHEIYSSFGISFSRPLARIPWDKIRGDFYTAFRSRMDMTPTDELPKKMATSDVTALQAQAMLHHFSYTAQNFPGANIIVEAPLFGGRGENVLAYARKLGIPHMVFVAHSPDMMKEILAKSVRDVKTSADQAIMIQMHAQMVQLITGDPSMPEEEKTMAMFANFFRNRLYPNEGLVLEWSPNLERGKFEQTRRDFIHRETTPDCLSPLPQRKLSAVFYDVTLDLMQKEDFNMLVQNVVK